MGPADKSWSTHKELRFVDDLGTHGEDVPGVLGFSRLELLQGYERGLERRDEGRMDGIDRAEVLAHVRTLIVQERLSPKLRRASR